MRVSFCIEPKETHSKCCKCGELKPLDQFYTFKSKGKLYRRKKCKKCYSLYQLEMNKKPKEIKPVEKSYYYNPRTILY